MLLFGGPATVSSQHKTRLDVQSLKFILVS
jgi:hypothetical protein